MNRHLIVFAKAPRLGQVKRRLARDVGTLPALRFYRHTLEATLWRLHSGPWRSWLAITPDDADPRASVRLAPGLTILPQGGGDIGARMHRALSAVPPGPAVLIGADIPDVRSHHIEAAFRALGTHDGVFGPAMDGGFWLVGARRLRPLPRSFMTDVRWSTEHALKDTIASLGRGRTHALVDTLSDVDDGEAYARLLAR
jgi:rSAM/selenodomain-associated transferase 1